MGKKSIVGDNVFWYTMVACSVPLACVVFVGLNLIIRDGPEVPQELQYLEWVGGIGTLVLAGVGYLHARLANGPKKTTVNAGQDA